MKADIILLLKKGVVVQQYIVEHSTTAEAVFDGLCKDLDILDDIRDIYDYGVRYIEANRMLQGIGMEIIWFDQIEVNRHKN